MTWPAGSRRCLIRLPCCSPACAMHLRSWTLRRACQVSGQHWSHQGTNSPSSIEAPTGAPTSASPGAALFSC